MKISRFIFILSVLAILGCTPRVKTPLIIHWPEKLEEKNEVKQVLGHVIDLVPTCLSAAGVEKDDQQFWAFPGFDLLDATYLDEASDRTIFWEHLGKAAARKGNWKIVSEYPHDHWELYDLRTDPAEMVDVSGLHPSKMENLAKQYRQCEHEVGVKTKYD